MARASWGSVPSRIQAHLLSKDTVWRRGGCGWRLCSSMEQREAAFPSTQVQGVLGEMASRGESAPRSRDCVSSLSGPRVALIQPVNSGVIGREEEPEIGAQVPVSRAWAGEPCEETQDCTPSRG